MTRTCGHSFFNFSQQYIFVSARQSPPCVAGTTDQDFNNAGVKIYAALRVRQKKMITALKRLPVATATSGAFFLLLSFFCNERKEKK